MSIRAFLPAFTAALAFLATAAQAAPRAQHVFIISFDGGKPAVMKQSVMPETMEMAEAGAVTWEAHTILPSITLPSHTSMLTGVPPAKHKILWNDYEPQKGVVQVSTVFKEAHDAGLSTALFAGKEKFKHLDIPGTLDKFEIPAYAAKTVAAAAASYIEEKKPALCFIHFADSDGAGHKYGWGSEEQKKAFSDEDEALKTVRAAVKAAGIESTSTFILTADHGGHDKTHGTDSPEDVNIPWLAWGADVKPGTKITAPVHTYDTAATALWLLDVKVPADWEGKPVTSAFK